MALPEYPAREDPLLANPDDATAAEVVGRANRRELIKATAGVAGGLAAASYVKPSLLSLGIPVALAASGSSTGGSGGSTGNSTAACTPGYWGNAPKGKDLWDVANDPDWNTELSISPSAGNNPIYGSQIFSSYFTPVNSAYDPKGLMGQTMIYFASNGATSNWIEKAGRDVVAGVLNSAYFGQSGTSEYIYSISYITTAWTNAVTTFNNSGGTDVTGFENIHNTIGAQNSGPGTTCPL